MLRLEELPPETGKDEVQGDTSDFAEMPGHVAGEQGCPCVPADLQDAVSQAAL